MPVVTCPRCESRYDPGVDDALDGLDPAVASLKVVCPVCGQWLRLPENEAIERPRVPREVLDEMIGQSKLVRRGPRADRYGAEPRRRSREDNDDERERPTRGRRRDDEFDDPPTRRRDDDEADERPRRKKKTPMVVAIVLAAVFALCGGGVLVLVVVGKGIRNNLAAFGSGVESAESRNSNLNLRQIGLGIVNYRDTTGHLPNDSFDANGRPLLSWRVHLLPFVEEDGLYQQFNLNEPWDGPTNRPLLNRMPRVYASDSAGAGRTYYRGFTHEGGLFGPLLALTRQTVKVPDIIDGMSNTWMVVEAGDAVDWSKPDILDVPVGGPMPRLGGIGPSLPYFQVLMADGSVKKVRRDISMDTLRKLTIRNDGNVIPGGWEFDR